MGFGGFSFGSLGCGAADPGAPQLVERTGSFSGGDATVQLVASCATVAVSTTPGASWDVDVRGTENARPTLVESADELVVRAPDGPVGIPDQHAAGQLGRCLSEPTHGSPSGWR